MIEIVEEEQERREPKTLEEYIEQMEESEKKKLFDYLKGREGKKDDENNKEGGCLFCKRKEIEIRRMSFVDKNGKIVVSMSACYECLKQMKEELERKLEE